MSYLVKFEDVSSSKINPLEGNDSLQSAAIPATWTPQHVALRLLEAFKIDDRLPKVASPKRPGSAHPAIEYTAEERAEWEPHPLDDRRFPVTREQQAVMDSTLEWLHFVRLVNLDAWRALRAYMLIVRRRDDGDGGQSIKRHCRKNGMLPVTFRWRKNRALSIISSRLNADSAAVF